MEDKFYRAITHQGYKSEKVEKGLKNSFHHVPKAILRKKVLHVETENVGKNKEFHYVDANCMSLKTASRVLPLLGGAISLFVLLLYLWRGGGDYMYQWTTARIVMISISSFFLTLCFIYYLTMPSKEDILNRKEGIITFTGSFWGKNITMPFSKVLFHFSTGGDNAVGAYMLQIVRPTNHTFRIFPYGRECYESISGIVWYMDKNRPLPPGTAFDPYREQDFERRKAEGFPPPLYPSQVATPEATKAQQKERDKYWKDKDYITNINY